MLYPPELPSKVGYEAPGLAKAIGRTSIPPGWIRPPSLSPIQVFFMLTPLVQLPV
jgi:hypothetical protein